MSANWSNRQEDEARELMPLLLDAIHFAHETAQRPLSPEMERLGDLYNRMGNWCWCAEDHESRECPPHVDLSRAHPADRTVERPAPVLVCRLCGSKAIAAVPVGSDWGQTCPDCGVRQ